MDFMNREKMTEVITESPTMSKADKLREAVSRNRQANLEGFKPIDDKSKPVRTVKDVLDVIKRYVPQGGGGGYPANLAGGGGGGGGGPVEPTPLLIVKDEGVQVVAAAASMNFVGDLVTVTESPVGEARVQVRGPAVFDSPAPGVPGTQIKSSATAFELGPNLVKQTFGANGRVYIDAAGVSVADEGLVISPAEQFRSINFVGAGVTATSPLPGVVEVNIPGGGGGGGGGSLEFFDDTRITADDNSVTGLNVLTPGLNPVMAINLASTDSAFAVTGGSGNAYASVDIGIGAVQITPTATLPDNAKGNFSVAIGSSDTSGTPAATNAIAEIAIGGTTNGNGGAVAIGLTSSAGGGAGQSGADGAVAVGQGSSANFRRSVAVGRSANTSDVEAVAVGNSATSAGFGVSIGTLANAGNSAVAAGPGALAGATSVAIGSNSNSGGVAVGFNTQAGDDATAIGEAASALPARSVAMGKSASAAGVDAVAIGNLSTSLQQGVAIGELASSGTLSVAHGSSASANGFDAVAVGKSATITNGSNAQNNEGSVAVGAVATCDGVRNIALGALARTAVGVTNSGAIGYDAVAPASNQIQIGNSAQTTYVFGTVQDRSDARDKAEVRDTELGLNFIMSLRPVDYKWDYREDYFTLEEVVGENGEISYNKVPVQKDGSKVRTRFHHGFIAQEVGSSGFEFGGHQDHSIKNPGVDIQSLGYAEFIAPLVKAVQEQQKIIEELKAEIAAMKAA